jgi:hypothetical protein
MTEKQNDKPRTLRRLQLVPFFDNISTYKQALMIANATNVRLNQYIINALSDYNMTEFKTPLQYDSITDLHNKLGQIAKKRNRSISSSIEVIVKEYSERKFKEMQ